MAEAQPKPEYRCHVRLDGGESFDDDLGSFGEVVGPRYDVGGKALGDFRKREEEDWCLRRLLIAWKRDGRMTWPCEIMAYKGLGGAEGLPDFLIRFGAGPEFLGVEVTQATCPAFQKEVGDEEKQGAEDFTVIGAGDGWGGDAPERQAVDEIFQAIERKLKRRADHGYAASELCDLVIYLNSETSVFVKPGDIVQRLCADPKSTNVREADPGFRQVHILFGDEVALDVFGNTQGLVSIATAYEHDFVQWLEHQAALARAGEAMSLDLTNLAEELRSLAGSERRARDRHLKNLLLHLLKWFYQQDKRSSGWLRSIAHAREQIEELIERSPNLGRKEDLNRALESQYPKALKAARLDTGLPASTFPSSCPFTIEQIRDPEYPPELAA
jgi:hypothetical protein